MSTTQAPVAAYRAASIHRYSPTSAAVRPKGSAPSGTTGPGTVPELGPVSDNRGRSVDHRAVVVGDRHAPILAERLAGDPDPGRHLAALVLGPVDQADHPGDRIGIEALGHQLVGRPVGLDVTRHHRIQYRVGRKRLVVPLVGAELGGRGLVEDR